MDKAGVAAPRGRGLLTAARVFAAALALFQLAGVFFFTVLAREEAIWLGPLIDVPIVGLMVVGMLLKLAFGVWPRLLPERRIALGLAGVALGFATNLVKIPLYDEPEGVLLMAADAVLLVLLLLATRGLGSSARRDRAVAAA
ncbi:hypothetical protein [Ornithinimicrobium cerasi]|uniref:DoxX-like family protein n=1 Tax=Ornithinimicrobium cerasi TaxID=2248773 RepID=A0A285VDV3_9MICO|nr:hypothetical protein [Ornithinimicrobium cerasi]SOC52305.1 hypothetical protein SAMN05421879_101482 [Ornithinimicrobium cerasi]